MEEVRPDDGKISMFRHRTARSPQECAVRVLAHLHRLPYGGNINEWPKAAVPFFWTTKLARGALRALAGC